MDRRVLLDAMKMASPALARTDEVPAEACLFFDEDGVTAFDGRVAIFAGVKSDLRGGIAGSTSVAWLSATSASDVTFDATDSKVQLRAGRSKLTLPLLPLGDRPFTWPDKPGDASRFAVDDDVMAALKVAKVTMGDDPKHPWRMGVTISLVKGGLVLYSSDNFTMTRCAVRCEVDRRAPAVVMPPRLVEVLTSINYRGDVYFDGDEILAAGLAESVWSSAMSEVSVEQYRQIHERFKKEELVKIPEGLPDMLKRSMIVLGSKVDDGVKLSVKGGKLRLGASSSLGGLADYVPVKGHADVEVNVNPALVHRWLPHASSFAVTEHALVLRGKVGRGIVVVLP